MPKGHVIPTDMKQKIYTAHCLGESNGDIAERLGLSRVTVQRIVREQRRAFEKERADMARSGKIVKKDGNGGKLIALPTDGFEFTHVIPDGKSHKKKMPGHSARVAESQYDQWCQTLDDECEFMRKVERRPKEEGFVPTEEEIQFFMDEEPKAVCGYPDDPIEEIHPIQTVEANTAPDIQVKPWRQVAVERQQRIEGLEARIAELESKASDTSKDNWVIADTELEEPKLAHWFNSNGTFRVVWTAKPVYVLWAKTDSPRLYGVYQTMEQALKKLDELNDVAAFLGNDSAFEVEEVTWRA